VLCKSYLFHYNANF